jgi:peptide/nickel transport system permease protein
MLRYIAGRLLQALIILFGVSVIVFFLINKIPGNPYTSMIPLDIPQDQIETMLRQVGYYDALPLKYLKWISRVARGDFGYSIFYRDKVTDVIASRMGNTFLLAVSSIMVSIVIGVFPGMLSAKKRNSLSDRTVSMFTFLLLSFPSFFLGMLMIKIFSVDLKLFPISGKTSIRAGYQGFSYALDVLWHMVLPTLILGLTYAASMLRYIRSHVFEILNADYIRSARAHGITEGKIFFRHILKNTLIPIVTVLSLQIPDILSGALLAETVFVWPGLGRLSYEAVGHRDYPLVMGILLVMGFITLASNLLADILYALIDQRITLGTEKSRIG